ncbi:MAG: hypothetical protein U0326_41820 [Polyangiales bacterium]
MTAELQDVIAALHRDGARTSTSCDLLAARSPDEAVEALVAARFPQYAARAVEALGAPLAEAFARRAGALSAQSPEAFVVLGGLLAAAHREGRALDARFDPLLAKALTTWWADEVHVILAAGLAALPAKRREAAVFSDPGRIAWRYLSACVSESARRLAVRVASLDPRDDLFPSARHEVVVGLTSLAPSVAPLLAAALRSGDGSRAGRRVLVASLARLDGELDALRACLDDPDPLVRRLARDGFDHRHVELSPTARVPDACLRARALRASITAGERDAMASYVRDAARDASESKRTLDAVFDDRARPVADAARAFATASDLWIDALRCGRWEPPLYAYELLMRRSLAASEPDPVAPWLVADALCRIPPDELDPMRAHHAFLTLPDAVMAEVVRALGATLSPEDAGNPLGLYDWLAARAAPDAPAFARGVVDPDPRVRLVCARATGRRNTAASAWSLSTLRRAFDALRASGHWGEFRLVAIDHVTQCWELSALDASDEPDRARARDEAAMALTLGAAQEPLEMARCCLALLLADEEVMRDVTWSPIAFEALTAGMIDTSVGDDPKTSRVEATLRVEALVACLDRSAVCLAAPGAARVAWSQAWFLQHPERRYSVAVAYLNDQ